MNKKTEITVSIPTRLLGELELKLYDPGLGKATYGARSALIVKLLQEWLDKEKEDERAANGPHFHDPIDPDGNAYDPNPPWRP